MPERSFGALSAEMMICFPASISALKVWKNSSCVLSLPIRNCRSSTMSTCDGAELGLELHGVVRAQRRDEAVHELLGRHVGDGEVRGLLAQRPGDGVHQVRLAQPHAAIEEERVEAGLRRALRHAAGAGMGELVGLADDEGVEGEALVERHEPVVAQQAVGRGGGRAPRQASMGAGAVVTFSASWAGSSTSAGDGGLGAGGLHAQRHLADAGHLRLAGQPQPVAVMVAHPVAEEAGRQVHEDGFVLDAGQVIWRSQLRYSTSPTSWRRRARTRAQLAAVFPALGGGVSPESWSIPVLSLSTPSSRKRIGCVTLEGGGAPNLLP
jgi:hypothetical protein